MVHRRVLLLSALATPTLAPPARAQGRPLRIVVPFGPGGFSDVLARFLADRLTQSLGQPVLVENRPGAGGNIAAEAVSRAAPDGTTLLLAGQAITSINPALYASLPFDPVRDFAVVGFVAAGPNMLLGGPAAPDTLAGLIAAAKAAPGSLAYASVGVGSVTHLAAAMLCAMAGISMEHVPYRSAGAAQADVLAGRVAVMFENAGTALAIVRGGQLQALGVSSATRMEALPAVPAIAELLPGFNADGWYGLLAQAATPAPALQRLRAELATVLASAEYRKFLADRGATPMQVPPAQATAFLEADRARWGQAVRQSGARVE